MVEREKRERENRERERENREREREEGGRWGGGGGVRGERERIERKEGGGREREGESSSPHTNSCMGTTHKHKVHSTSNKPLATSQASWINREKETRAHHLFNIKSTHTHTHMHAC